MVPPQDIHAKGVLAEGFSTEEFILRANQIVTENPYLSQKHMADGLCDIILKLSSYVLRGKERGTSIVERKNGKVV